MLKKGNQCKSLRRVSDEVYYAGEDVVKVNNTEIEFIKNKALLNNKKRCRLCTHEDVTDKVHEMLIVHTKNAYVRPHKHVDRTVSYHVIEGSADLILFDDNGGIKEVMNIGERSSGKVFYFRLRKSVYYSLLVRSDVFIFHEVVGGPFVRDGNMFPPWAPDGSDGDKLRIFLSKLEQSLVERKK